MKRFSESDSNTRLGKGWGQNQAVTAANAEPHIPMLVLARWRRVSPLARTKHRFILVQRHSGPTAAAAAAPQKSNRGRKGCGKHFVLFPSCGSRRTALVRRHLVVFSPALMYVTLSCTKQAVTFLRDLGTTEKTTSSCLTCATSAIDERARFRPICGRSCDTRE